MSVTKTIKLHEKKLAQLERKRQSQPEATLPAIADICNKLADNYVLQANTEKADHYYRQSINDYANMRMYSMDFVSQELDAYIDYADFLYDLDKVEEALLWYQKTLKIAPLLKNEKVQTLRLQNEVYKSISYCYADLEDSKNKILCQVTSWDSLLELTKISPPVFLSDLVLNLDDIEEKHEEVNPPENLKARLEALYSILKSVYSLDRDLYATPLLFSIAKLVEWHKNYKLEEQCYIPYLIEAINILTAQNALDDENWEFLSSSTRLIFEDNSLFRQDENALALFRKIILYFELTCPDHYLKLSANLISWLPIMLSFCTLLVEKGHHDEALTYYKKGLNTLKEATQNGEIPGQNHEGIFNKNIGDIHNHLGNIEARNDAYQSAITGFEESINSCNFHIQDAREEIDSKNAPLTKESLSTGFFIMILTKINKETYTHLTDIYTVLGDSDKAQASAELRDKLDQELTNLHKESDPS